MNKQTHPHHYEQIQTDGCYFMVDLSIGEDIALRLGRQHHQMEPYEVNLAYNYAIPNFMRDGGHIREDRCFILKHEQIIAIGLYIMGVRIHTIDYLYRKDGDIHKIGIEESLDLCNYFVKEVLVGSGPATHFVRCDRRGVTLYNPGISDDHEWESFRGYRVKAV